MQANPSPQMGLLNSIEVLQASRVGSMMGTVLTVGDGAFVSISEIMQGAQREALIQSVVEQRQKLLWRGWSLRCRI